MYSWKNLYKSSSSVVIQRVKNAVFGCLKKKKRLCICVCVCCSCTVLSYTRSGNLFPATTSLYFMDFGEAFLIKHMGKKNEMSKRIVPDYNSLSTNHSDNNSL